MLYDKGCDENEDDIDGSNRVNVFSMFKINLRRLYIIQDVIITSILLNLHKRRRDGQPESWCYIQSLPSGEEKGVCLGLNLLTSMYSFETAAALLEKPDHSTVNSRFWTDTFPLSESFRYEDGCSMFEFMMKCMRGSYSRLLGNNRVPIGLSLGVPIDTKLKPPAGIESKTIGTVSKDLHMAHFFNENLVNLGNRASRQSQLNATVTCVLNDCAATLMHGIYLTQRVKDQSRDCSMSLISARDCANMAYIEHSKDFLSACSPDYSLLLKKNSMFCCVVDSMMCFAGNRGEFDSILNPIDKEIRSQLGNDLTWKDFASGVLFPDLLRYSIAVLQSTGQLQYNEEEEMVKRNCCFDVFSTCCRSGADGEWTTAQLTQQLQPLVTAIPLHPDDAEQLQRLCHAIVKRCSIFLSLGIISLAERIYTKWPRTVMVAINGNIFSLIGTLRQVLEETVNGIMGQLHPKLSQVKIELTNCNAALGVAIGAAAANNWANYVAMQDGEMDD